LDAATTLLQELLPEERLDPSPFTGKPWKVDFQAILRSKEARPTLTRVLHENTYARAYGEGTARQKALLLVQRADGGGEVVNLCPNVGEGTVIAPKSFRRAMKYHSGVELFPMDGKTTASMVCVFCDNQMDVWGDHVSTCRSAGLGTRHNRLRDKNAFQLCRGGYSGDLEPTGLVEDDDKRPADVLVRSMIDAKDVWIDHTVKGPYSPSMLLGSARVHNFAVHAKENEKNSERSGALQAAMDSGALYFPFAVTTVGGFGTPALRILRAMASKVAGNHRMDFARHFALLKRELVTVVHRGNNELWEQQELFFNALPGADGWSSRNWHKWGRRSGGLRPQ
jgi:hypothetical protein